MFRPLLRTVPALSGNFSVNCIIDDVDLKDNKTYVREANLMPISSYATHKRYIPVNLLKDSYEYDVKQYYKYYSTDFYNNVFRYDKTNYQQFNRTEENNNRSKDYEFGVSRISYNDYKKQLLFYAPLYCESIDDLPEYFTIELNVFSNKRKYLSKKIRILIGEDDSKNYLKTYLSKYLEQIDDECLYVIADTGQISVKGIDCLNGGFSNVVDNTVFDIFNKQMTIGEFDSNLCSVYSKNNMILKQVIPLSFSFNIDDLLTEYENNLYKNYEFTISGHYVHSSNDNDIKIRMYDFEFNYNKYYIDTYTHDDCLGLYKDKGNINIMGNTLLKESSLYESKESMLAPNKCRWKSIDNNYIVNVDEAFSIYNNRYLSFPNLNVNKYATVKIKNNNLIIDYSDETYIKLLNSNLTTWFDVYKFDEDSTGELKFPANYNGWMTVHTNKLVEFGGITYNLNNVDLDIDKFAVFLDIDILDGEKYFETKYLFNTDYEDYSIKFNCAINIDDCVNTGYDSEFYNLSVDAEPNARVETNVILEKIEDGETPDGGFYVKIDDEYDRCNTYKFLGNNPYINKSFKGVVYIDCNDASTNVKNKNDIYYSLNHSSNKLKVEYNTKLSSDNHLFMTSDLVYIGESNERNDQYCEYVPISKSIESNLTYYDTDYFKFKNYDNKLFYFVDETLTKSLSFDKILNNDNHVFIKIHNFENYDFVSKVYSKDKIVFMYHIYNEISKEMKYMVSKFYVASNNDKYYQIDPSSLTTETNFDQLNMYFIAVVNEYDEETKNTNNNTNSAYTLYKKYTPNIKLNNYKCENNEVYIDGSKLDNKIFIDNHYILKDNNKILECCTDNISLTYNDLYELNSELNTNKNKLTAVIYSKSSTKEKYKIYNNSLDVSFYVNVVDDINYGYFVIKCNLINNDTHFNVANSFSQINGYSIFSDDKSIKYKYLKSIYPYITKNILKEFLDALKTTNVNISYPLRYKKTNNKANKNNVIVNTDSTNSSTLVRYINNIKPSIVVSDMIYDSYILKFTTISKNVNPIKSMYVPKESLVEKIENNNEQIKVKKLLPIKLFNAKITNGIKTTNVIINQLNTIDNSSIIESTKININSYVDVVESDNYKTIEYKHFNDNHFYNIDSVIEVKLNKKLTESSIHDYRTDELAYDKFKEYFIDKNIMDENKILFLYNNYNVSFIIDKADSLNKSKQYFYLTYKYTLK